MVFLKKTNKNEAVNKNTLNEDDEETMVKSLLKNGEAKVKSLTGKDGNKFDALLKYEKNSNGYYSWLIKKDQ